MFFSAPFTRSSTASWARPRVVDRGLHRTVDGLAEGIGYVSAVGHRGRSLRCARCRSTCAPRRRLPSASCCPAIRTARSRSPRPCSTPADVQPHARPVGLHRHRGRRPPLSVQSTGMGGPSTAIVVEELIDLGANRLIRIGTCGALVEGFGLGELVNAHEVIASDGASSALGAGEPLRPDAALGRRARGAAGHGGVHRPLLRRARRTSPRVGWPRAQRLSRWRPRPCWRWRPARRGGGGAAGGERSARGRRAAANRRRGAGGGRGAPG